MDKPKSEWTRVYSNKQVTVVQHKSRREKMQNNLGKDNTPCPTNKRNPPEVEKLMIQ